MREPRSRSLICGSALMVSLLSVVAMVGCGNGGDRNGGDGNGNGDSAVVAMMERLPSDAADFTFTDLAAVRADDDIYELYGGAEKRIESECAALGISADDVDKVAECDTVTILEGSFYLDEVSRQLEDNGYEAGKYEGVDTWESSSANIQAVALVGENCIVVGSSVRGLEDCVDVIRGNADSLSDSEDLSEVVARLPAGLMVVIYSGDSDLGSVAYGASSTKEDSNTVRMTQVFLFDDDEAASDAIEGLGNVFEEGYQTDKVEVRQDGRSITVIVDLNIDDILG